ncbi:hypothetical protein C8R47DRAFT_1079313 [Mycena vitilis]|nr:hypothetical protein C8R47DRAFT_1079313 [Mycena vitilis]
MAFPHDVLIRCAASFFLVGLLITLHPPSSCITFFSTLRAECDPSRSVIAVPHCPCYDVERGGNDGAGREASGADISGLGGTMRTGGIDGKLGQGGGGGSARLCHERAVSAHSDVGEKLGAEKARTGAVAAPGKAIERREAEWGSGANGVGRRC